MVKSSDIAKYLGLTLLGNDITVIRPCSLNNIMPGALLFASKFSEEIITVLNRHDEILVIAAPKYEGLLECNHLISSNPRLDFARAMQRFFVKPIKPIIEKTSIIGNNVRIGENVSIGHYCVIGDNVSIGDGTVISKHVVFAFIVIIGRRCFLKSLCVIGEEGFGFERDESGVQIRIPHIGSVVVGNDVEVGSFATIMRGTLDNTIIGNNVKIDDHSLIAHNCIIEDNCMLTACLVGGSTHVKQNSFITTNSAIRNGITIGKNVLVGIGSTVTKSTEDNVIIAGNPARVMRTR